MIAPTYYPGPLRTVKPNGPTKRSIGAQVEVRFRVVGMDFQGLLEVRGRLGQPFWISSELQCEIVLGFG